MQTMQKTKLDVSQLTSNLTKSESNHIQTNLFFPYEIEDVPYFVFANNAFFTLYTQKEHTENAWQHYKSYAYSIIYVFEHKV